MRLQAILASLETIAPARFAFEFDKVGLQVGDLSQKITKAVVSLDRSLGAVAHATSNGAELLLAHHPLIFTPLASVTSQTHVGRTVLALATGNIAFVAAHTNWDSARGGVNDALANLLGLTDLADFGSAAEVVNFLIEVEATDNLPEEFFATTKPMGDPTKFLVGGSSLGRIERLLGDLVPYLIFPQKALKEQPAGRIGKLSDKTALSDFASTVATTLNTKVEAWGNPSAKIRKVAVTGGAADSEWMNAQRAGADVLITGEVKQHVGLEASESGMTIIAAGHYATEQPGVVALAKAMEQLVPEVEWLVYEPHPGSHGRPFTA